MRHGLRCARVGSFRDMPENTVDRRQKPHPDKLLLSPTEVAELLGVSERWVRAKATTPGFPRKVRIGGRLVRYRRSDVERWIDSL